MTHLRAIYCFFWVISLITISYTAYSKTAYFELVGESGFSYRVFNEEPNYDGQSSKNLSFYLEPEFFYEWNQRLSFTFRPFTRYDNVDHRRTHTDIREAILKFIEDDWEVGLGIDRIFWGVAESKNLVDVINQTDSIEGPSTEEKLGQPIISYTKISRIGYFDVFYMPYFRLGNSPGRQGRLRIDPIVDYKDPIFSGGAGRWSPDVAVRWSDSFGGYDLSFHCFRGNGRESSINPKIVNGELKYIAGYERTSQIGMTGSYSKGPWLFKMESLYRRGQNNVVNIRKSFGSYIVGLERTFTRAVGEMGDLTLFGEYISDNRRVNSPETLENDIFMAARLSLNDIDNTELFFASTRDLGGEGNTFTLEFSRRLHESIKINITGNVYWSAVPGNPTYSLRRDDFIELNLTKFF